MYTRTVEGDNPLSLATVKQALKLSTIKDDGFITSLMSAVIAFGEGYVGREFRANTFTVLLDVFSERIRLKKSQTTSITSIKYYDQSTPSSVQQTVSNTVYYLKQSKSWSDVILNTAQDWPTDVDDLQAEHRIEITFVTRADPEYLDLYKQSMIRHISYLYQNRGDCEVDEKSVRLSGAAELYGIMGMPRI